MGGEVLGFHNIYQRFTVCLFWHTTMGVVGAIIRDNRSGKLIGGTDPRQENWTAGKLRYACQGSAASLFISSPALFHLEALLAQF